MRSIPASTSFFTVSAIAGPPDRTRCGAGALRRQPGVAIPKIGIIVCYPIVMIELIFILALLVSAAVASTQSERARGARSSRLRAPLVARPCCVPQRHAENMD